ncbi:hypothetical protein [Nocardioides panacis]|uniref:hypothetical protein n=1 Tax=Nocardioides panacis TaxID=2849501 RepID=UPI0020B3F8C6|nr:hypothetical protein [Nocardioides panacis]
MTDTEKPVEKTEEAPVQRKKKDRQVGRKVVAGTNAIRARIASVVWLVAVVCALFLAVGALLVALKMNQDNAIVAFVLDGAAKLDFGSFKDFTGKGAATKEALTNWGIAAVIYLVVGKVLDRIIRP